MMKLISRNLVFFSLFILSIYSANLFAYPNFIGHGYNSCITCHYNPFGNGPINDYGRAVSGTAIASRNFYSSHKPEEKIGEETGFLFRPMPNNVFRPFVGYRGMILKRNVGEVNETSEYINMQLDVNTVFKFGEADKYIASFTMGYTPIPRSLKNTPAANDYDEYRTREHYVGYRPSPSLGIYAGLMDKTYGIRLVEHNSFSRTVPQLTMNDQSHGVVIHYIKDKFEGGLNYFVGNMAQDADLRQKGFAGTFEYTMFENFRPGFSYLSSENKYLKMSSMATHLRSSLGNTGSLMTEIGVTEKAPVTTGVAKKEVYGFLQAHLKSTRGLYILNSVEYYKKTSESNYKIRFGPSLQYFPISRIEFRFDLYNTRVFSSSKSTPDTWDFLGQLHLWF